MNDDKVDEYLWDPNAPPADEVVEIERILRPLRHEPVWRRRRIPQLWLAAAAMLLLVIGVGAWLTTRPRLTAGESLDAGRHRITHFGWIDVARDSSITMRSSRNVVLKKGRVHVSLWAPPRTLSVSTPAGSVVDLGCQFILDVDEKRTAVEVISGWVQLDNEVGSVAVPGGASSEMFRSKRPSVPVFRSAAPEFRAAVRNGDLNVILRTARRRDVLTLLLLAQRRPEDREALLRRAAELYPPHRNETLLAARAGGNDAIAQWIDDLPLPPEKAWIRNWRDAL